jgi:hypothetical protein
MVACTYFMLYLYGVYVVYSENLENDLDVCCVNNILFSDLRISYLRIMRKCLKLKNYSISIIFLIQATYLTFSKILAVYASEKGTSMFLELMVF